MKKSETFNMIVDFISSPYVEIFSLIIISCTSIFLVKYSLLDGRDERGQIVLGYAFKKTYGLIILFTVLKIFFEDIIRYTQETYINSVLISLAFTELIGVISVLYYSKKKL